VPEDGEIIKRLIELAQERNISYVPSHESKVALDDYCTRKNIPVINKFNINHCRAH
jgi:hypothetical protein